MKNLLKIEWLKIKNYKPFWIILILLFLTLPACSYIMSKLVVSSGNNADIAKQMVGTPFNFNTIFDSVAYINNSLNIGWALLLIFMVGNEWQNRTLRQNVIDGQTRNQIIISKLFIIGILSIVSTLLMIITGFLLGIINSETSFTFDINFLKSIGVNFFATYMQLLFALVFAFLIKRPALSVIIYLGYTVFIENIIVGLSAFNENLKFIRYLFTQAADELTINTFGQKSGIVTNMDLPTTIVVCSVYAALILVGLFAYIKRTALK